MRGLPIICLVNGRICQKNTFKEEKLMSFEFEATIRTDHGKGASRRLRRNDQLPAVVYGKGQPAVSITLDHEKVNLAQAHDTFYSEELTINIDGTATKVKVQAMQRHAYKPKLLHLDFLRI